MQLRGLCVHPPKRKAHTLNNIHRAIRFHNLQTYSLGAVGSALPPDCVVLSRRNQRT
jgi:hypothetical protein